MKLNMRNAAVAVTFETLSANTEKGIAWTENDEHMILVVNASAATDLTVKAGNGLWGVTDLKLSVPKGISLLKLESGRFKNVSGTSKGKVILVSSGTPSVGAVAIV